MSDLIPVIRVFCDADGNSGTMIVYQSRSRLRKEYFKFKKEQKNG